MRNMKANIIQWYEFKNNKSILQIGIEEELTTYLNTVFEEVVVIQNHNEIPENKVFSYVLIYHQNEAIKKVEELSQMLDENGKILWIGNNSFGINDWSKYCLEDETKGILKLQEATESKTDLVDIVKQLENNHYHINHKYYIFPNTHKADLIIKENSPDTQNLIGNYIPNIQKEETRVFDEIKVIKKIAQKDSRLLDFFANSFLIECGKTKTENEIQYVCFNNYRKQEYQLMTIIKSDVVEKKVVTEKASNHIENMKEIIDELNNTNICILDDKKEDKIVSKKITTHKTLDKVLAEHVNDRAFIIERLQELKEILEVHPLEYESIKQYIPEKYKEHEIQLQKMSFLENAYWDMVPKNCFYIDQKYYFFDQEWKEKYLPVEFILYRSIINCYELVSQIQVDELFEEMGILEFISIFEQIDMDIRNKIIDQETYDRYYDKQEVKSIDNLINENHYMKLNDEAQNNYIKNLEEQLKDVKQDNENKQAYIETLENLTKKKR